MSDSPSTTAKAPTVVDLRPMFPAERHTTVFAALESLEPGATFVLMNDHAPVPLLQRIAQNWPDQFESEFLADGPEVWQVAITRKNA
ncbi:DUF2249 domain-containing protein [Phaeovulum sp.]|uniref:DUF2249 domain-containing protein n=1 Tax=Phaeovulum sp. TaxID=2934796 RepID=UPI0039E43EE6